MILLHIMGFLGADPETRYTTGGQKVTTLRVATKSRKGGQEETIWWRITVWGDQYDKMLVHFKKGSAIYLVAEMQKLDIYQDKNGQPQVSYDATARSIHFPPLNNRTEGEQTGNSGNNRQSTGTQGSDQSPYSTSRVHEGKAESFSELEEDSIPF